MGSFANSHDFTITNSEMNDIAGDQHVHDHSTHNNWENCNNTRNTNISDSYNNYSKRLTTNHNYFNHNGGGGTFNNVSGTQVNNSASLNVSSPIDEGVPRSAFNSKSLSPQTYQGPLPYTSPPSPTVTFKSNNPFVYLALEYERIQQSKQIFQPTATATKPTPLLLPNTEGADISGIVAEDDLDEAWADEQEGGGPRNDQSLVQHAGAKRHGH